MRYRVGIVGAAGYAGVELVRRIAEHPSFELAVVTSDADAGVPLSALYPAFLGKVDLAFSPHSTPELLSCDVVFLCVPHTASMAVAPGLLAAGVSVVDLSADFRLKDAATFEAWYGAPHTAPELLERAAFGLPELTGDELAVAAAAHATGEPALVACAGCYVTASTLAAAPAVRAGLTEGVINVHACSGVTGAGRKASARTHYCHAADDVEAYGVGSHRHQPEMEQILGVKDRVVFVPHLVPAKRGILSTVSMQVVPAAGEQTLEQLHTLYQDFYADSPFVTVLAAGQQPCTSSVVGTNNAQLGLAWVPATRTLVVTSAIDNLGKGAADQAVQCANIIFGLPQETGLGSLALPV